MSRPCHNPSAPLLELTPDRARTAVCRNCGRLVIDHGPLAVLRLALRIKFGHYG